MTDPFTTLTSALADRYTIERELGRGGAAAVFLAEDLRHHRKVALKILRPEVAEAVGPDRFLKEIEVAAGLSHPHIVPLYDSGDASGVLYFVMPYVEGESLRDRLDREGALPIDEAVRIARELADALGYAHARGVVHRDVKPENVLLEAGHAVLADFGVARAIHVEEDQRLTRSGMAVGTPAYMSPEQAAGDEQVDGRADQYALGCLLYEMLTGLAPYSGPSSESVIRQHLAGTPAPVAQVRPSVPAGVAAALERAMAKVSADRFGCMEAFAGGLLDSHGPTASSAPRSRRKTGLLWATLGVIAVALTAVAWWSTSSGGTAELANEVAVVLPFEDNTGGVAPEGVGLALGWHVTRTLTEAGDVRPIAWSSVESAWEEAPEAAGTSGDRRHWVAQRFQAGVVVRGSIFHLDGDFTIQADIAVDGGAERFAGIEPVVVPVHQLESGFDSVAVRLAAAMAYGRPAGWSTSASLLSPMPTVAIARDYKDAYRLAGRDASEALPLVEDVLRRDSTFAPARLLMAIVQSNLGRRAVADSILDSLEPAYENMPLLERLSFDWHRASLAGDRLKALQVAREVTERTSTWVAAYTHGFEALRSNRPQEALDVLAEGAPGGESSFPPRYWEYRGQALHLLGRHEEELAVAREGAGEFPNSPTIARTALRALVALDRLAAVDSVVAVVGTATGSNADLAWTASLELRAHGHVEEALATANSAYEELLEQAPKDGSEAGLEARVRLLYAAERWGEALSVAEKLAEIDPRDPDHLGYLGCAHARLGQRLEAEAVSRRLEALDEAYLRGGHTYNRASIAAVLGHQAEAVRLLQQAHQQGMYLNIWATHLDPDMRPLREFGPFMSFIEPRG